MVFGLIDHIYFLENAAMKESILSHVVIANAKVGMHIQRRGVVVQDSEFKNCPSAVQWSGQVNPSMEKETTLVKNLKITNSSQTGFQLSSFGANFGLSINSCSIRDSGSAVLIDGFSSDLKIDIKNSDFHNNSYGINAERGFLFSLIMRNVTMTNSQSAAVSWNYPAIGLVDIFFKIEDSVFSDQIRGGVFDNSSVSIRQHYFGRKTPPYVDGTFKNNTFRNNIMGCVNVQIANGSLKVIYAQE